MYQEPALLVFVQEANLRQRGAELAPLARPLGRQLDVHGIAYPLFTRLVADSPEEFEAAQHKRWRRLQQVAGTAEFGMRKQRGSRDDYTLPQ